MSAEHAGVTPMPLYRSHKIVRGAPIRDADIRGGENGRTAVDVVINQVVEKIEVPAELGLKIHNLLLEGRDGYLVEYDDGYLSWSPEKAFVEGYTAVQEGATDGASMDGPDA